MVKWTAVFVVVGVLTGCGTGSATPPTAVARSSLGATRPNLVGGIFYTGRVPRHLAKNGLQAGRVDVLETNRGLVAREWVRRYEGFAFRLRPGVYTPQAKISLGTCTYGGSADGTVVVRKGRITRANLYCMWH